MKFMPLSVKILPGKPLRATNLVSAASMQLVVSSEQSSKCTLLVQKHANTQTYDLILTGRRGLPLFVEKGPAKSMPVQKKGDEGRERSTGSCPMSWEEVLQ